MTTTTEIRDMILGKNESLPPTIRSRIVRICTEAQEGEAYFVVRPVVEKLVNERKIFLEEGYKPFVCSESNCYRFSWELECYKHRQDMNVLLEGLSEMLE